jgi:hypothetical protein
VQADTNRSIVTADTDGVVANLQSVSYSFGMWLSYEIFLVRPLAYFA